MRQKTLSLKALVPALMLGLGLSGVTGVGHAQAASSSDATTMNSSHSPAVQQGNDYNYSTGGGGD
ncbi:MAG: hypothetical protein ABSC06_14725 [Rhodopila sp.]|jgi:hypothetical protein